MPVSLTAARRALGRKLVAYEQGTTGIETAEGYAGTAEGSDANRAMVTSDLETTARSGAQPTASTDAWTGAWVYFPDLDPPVQRRVAQNGFAPSVLASSITDLEEDPEDVPKKTAVLYFERALVEPMEPDLVWEGHFRLPVLDQARLSGLHTIINRALRVMMIPDRISISGVSNQYRYDLTTHPWLEQGAQLAGTWDYETVSGTDPYPLPGRNRLRFDGQARYLILEGGHVPTGQTFYVDVYRPASSWIKTSSTWAASTVGLVNETDEAAVPLDPLVLVAAYHAAEVLELKDPRAPDVYWGRKKLEYAVAAAPYMKFGQAEHAPQRPARPGNVYGDDAGFLFRRSGGIRRGGGWSGWR